ncbi:MULTISPECIES: hypothetical protein [Streptomyces]|uniref:hypothetical protein n=1 Tax=Streptomyces TaxID=1883 RepID=UPI00159F31AD|nr:hypothetical protein [Streptomyces sp. PpalLS-921]
MNPPSRGGADQSVAAVEPGAESVEREQPAFRGGRDRVLVQDEAAKASRSSS